MGPSREPEQEARSEIDELLGLAGWSVQDVADTNLRAARGVAIREFPLRRGHGFADYLLYIDHKAAGLPDGLPSWIQPLPFAYQSTGVETRFTSRLDPLPRARNVFAFLTLEKFKASPFPLPPLAEQRRIVAEVDRLMSIARATEAQLDTALARAARLRQSILSRAFSGAAV